MRWKRECRVLSALLLFWASERNEISLWHGGLQWFHRAGGVARDCLPKRLWQYFRRSNATNFSTISIIREMTLWIILMMSGSIWIKADILCCSSLAAMIAKSARLDHYCWLVGKMKKMKNGIWWIVVVMIACVSGGNIVKGVIIVKNFSDCIIVIEKSWRGFHSASYAGVILYWAENCQPLPRGWCDKIPDTPIRLSPLPSMDGCAGNSDGVLMSECCLFVLAVSFTWITGCTEMPSGSSMRTALFPMSSVTLKGPLRRIVNFCEGRAAEEASVKGFLLTNTLSPTL